MKILLGCMLFLPILSSGQQREFNFYIEKKDLITTLQLTSLETFPCLGYSIRTFERWNYDTLVVEIRGFIKPQHCFSTVESARKNQTIRDLRSKQFVLQFQWNGEKDIWLIDISTESVSAIKQRVNFTSWFRD